ncbi:Hpt domain-containing protein [Spirochaeta africana]|uniref:HPt domain-containing protein n=1 Tax=Spirochaeta africana (strain ATCC 700263 / DSM 8902 / Z-7692) TaxID=889378 RepID=H9UG23_SPIAZ|nr:Hpt domain-containing protein [Spirochaeta africana]AFG36466.1 HPt domain-containing protein [Spirochaeta africana DSM 8902]
MNHYTQRFERFVARFSGHEEVVARMAGLFLQDAPRRLDEIDSGYRERDWERVITAAHSLVNIAGTMQAFEAAEQARKLEAAVRARAYAEIPQLSSCLQSDLQQALQVVHSYSEASV